MTLIADHVQEARRLVARAHEVAERDTSITTTTTAVLLDLSRAVQELAAAVDQLADRGR